MKRCPPFSMHMCKGDIMIEALNINRDGRYDHERTHELREASGSVNINSKLVGFLYELMRDYVTPGQIEALVQNCTEPECQYTNGWLARYAENLANKLR
jgi:hypothetical protein